MSQGSYDLNDALERLRGLVFEGWSEGWWLEVWRVIHAAPEELRGMLREYVGQHRGSEVAALGDEAPVTAGRWCHRVLGAASGLAPWTPGDVAMVRPGQVEVEALMGASKAFLGSFALRELPPWFVALDHLEGLTMPYTEVEVFPTLLWELESLRTLHCTAQTHVRPLGELPAGVRRLRHLEVLYLAGSAVEGVPPDIGEVASLRTLHLHTSRLRGLPEGVGALSGLRELTITASLALKGLPESIGGLSELRRLSVGYWPHRQFPPWLFGMKGLESCGFICDVRLEAGEEDRLRRALPRTKLHIGYTATAR